MSSTRVKDVAFRIDVDAPLRPSDDVRHPLRMCRMHTVSGATHDAAVEWIAAHRTKLLQGLVEMTEDGCEIVSALAKSRTTPRSGKTFLHVIAEHNGDPRFARMLLKHCSRFLRKDAKDAATERTALHFLFLERSTNAEPDHWIARAQGVSSAAYQRCLDLLRLLLEEALVSVHEEDCRGNTVTHFAACGHQQGSLLLPLLLVMGAPPASRNLAGRTPAQELLTRRDSHRLMTWDVADALRIMQQHGGGIDVEGSPSRVPLEDKTQDEALEAGAALSRRRWEATMLCSEGLDLPRQSLAIVDCVPPTIAPKPSNALAKAKFPTSVVDTDESGRPRYGGDPAWAPPTKVNQLIEAPRRDNEDDLASTVQSALSADTSGAPQHVIRGETMDQLQAEFASLDRDRLGWISVADMRREYLSYEGYGVSESAAEIDKMISVMGIRRDGRVTFDEYCVLMLRLHSR